MSTTDWISALDFGAVGDGITDDTAAIQDFVNALVVAGRKGYISAGRYRITSRINITGSCDIYGDGWQDLRDYTGPTTRDWSQAFPRGTIIYQDYTAATDQYGFYVTGNSVTIRDLEFEQNQGDPDSGSWTPVVGPWAIYSYTAPYYNQGGSSMMCYNIMLRNCYNGICIQGSARGILEKIFGQPINVGISVTQNGDVLRVRDIHFGWPFWSSSSQVFDNQLANTIGIQLGRVDNPNLESIFTFHCRIGIQFYVDTTPDLGGQTSQCCGSNWGFDDGIYGVYMQDSVDIKVTNLYIYCRSGTTPPSCCILAVNTLGSSYEIKALLSNLDLNGADTNAIFLANAGQCVISGITLRSWNGSNSGFSAIRTSAANIQISDPNTIGSSGNGASIFETDGTGTVSGYYDQQQTTQFSMVIVTGTCDSSGQATFPPPSSMSDPTAMGLQIQCFYASSTDNAMLPMSTVFLSTSEVAFNGGSSAAGRPFRATIIYAPRAIAGW